MNFAPRTLILICLAAGWLASSGCQNQQPDNLPAATAVTYLQQPATTVATGLTSRPLAAPVVFDGPKFTRVEGNTIGVQFHNQLDDENIKNYLLTGAGLTVGDIDHNGLPDLYLVSQDGPSKLFKQTAPWVFEDVTSAAGIQDSNRWGSGAAFVDIDNDGHLDLYICNKGAHDEIYMNLGDGTFKAEAFGRGDASLRAPTMVAFSDYDQDGDLDFYRTETRLLSVREMFNFKLNVVKNESGEWEPAPWHHGEFEIVGGNFVEVGNRDHLYRNEGSPQPGDIAFREVTRSAGISSNREHGLAAVWWDYNNDNAPDLYVSNDFHTPDHLFRNNQDGSFSEAIAEALPYTSWNSMGSDFADINNDGWIDYLTTDMSGTTHFKQKTMMGAMSGTAWFLDNLEPRQYMRNAMHVNTGTGKFIDIAFHAGLDSTDWTWTGIFGDLDNDGFEDAYFTNGIERNVQDTDLAARMDEAKENGGDWDAVHQVLLDSPRFQEVNLTFKNLGNLKFQNVSEAWGLADLTVSHGGLMVDLDRDGDLDIIVNNMNDPVGIYRNNSSGNNAILVSLRGTESNHFGLGARVEVKLPDGQTLTRLMTSSRGYMTGVEPVLHFGLGECAKIDSLKITWPTGRIQSYQSLESGFHYTVEEAEQTETAGPVRDAPSALFAGAADGLGIEFVHRENEFNDFQDQPLLPNRLSRFGPALAVGDATGNGRPDLYLGAAAGFKPQLNLMGEEGTYQHVSTPFDDDDKAREDVDATWFDADQDGDLDLYVVSGGASEPDQDQHYADRLYFNDGTGNLTRASADVLPALNNSGSCVAACDFDKDGDLDLFVGSRHIPGLYPTTPESSLLLNDEGKFSRAESPVNGAGLVTDATWADLDGDNRPELIVSTEWGPVKIFRNTPEGFLEVTEQVGLQEYTGWWNCVAAGDFDQDGDVDLIAGNFGSNTKYHVDKSHPATLFASDFGSQGKMQLVEAKCGDGKLLPIRGRSCSTSAMPHLKKLAPDYTTFALKSLPELYTPEALNQAIKLEAKTLKSMLFRNDGEGKFLAEPLPLLAQLSPVMDIALGDFNDDGVTDVALGQNFNDAQRETGRMNAGLGVILVGSLENGFTQLWPKDSGFIQRTNLRKLVATDLNQDGSLDLISANNQEQPTIHLGTKGN